MKHPFIRQIDHVGIQTKDPATLFRFFTDDLGLPVAFPYVEYANYWSGAVALGNIYLEIMRFVPPYRTLRTKPTSQYQILGFLVDAGQLPAAVDLLDQRRIAHGGIVPFFAPDATDDKPIAVWGNVYLGDLLGTNWWMRQLFAALRCSTPTPSQQRSNVVNTLVVPMLQRAFRNGMIVLTDYYQQNDDAKRAADADAFAACQGGVLGLLGVREIVIGTPDLSAGHAQWQRLLNPLQPTADHRWALPPGPAIRLVERSIPSICVMTLTVRTLDQAYSWIVAHGLQAECVDGAIQLMLPTTNGLLVKLITESSD